MALTKTALFFCFTITAALAFDPRPTQDFCVATPTSSGPIGHQCKDPSTVTSDDFYATGLHLPGNTSNPFGSSLKTVSALQLPGLNTLGLTLMRLDQAEGGFIPPHVHSRATEVVVVLEGTMEIGFVTSQPDNVNYAKTLNKGDVYVVPPGLIHYQRNLGRSPASALVAFNSQNPGIVVLTSGVFGAKPELNSDYLASAFRADKKTIEMLQAKF